MVDPELRRVERWRPGDVTPELLTERVVWRPVEDGPALEIDLEALFARVWR